MTMKKPPHPGVSVRRDCLDPLGLSVTEAAKRLGVSRKQLSDIVNGKSGISPKMAIRLDKAFGGGAETWHRLQTAYDFARAVDDSGDIQVERISISPAAFEGFRKSVKEPGKVVSGLAEASEKSKGLLREAD